MKTLALGIVILMLSVFVLSVMFTAVEADHDCSGWDCPVCMLIQQCEQTIRSIGGSVSFAAFSLLFASFCAIVIQLCSVYILYNTPISLKTRLNN